jgi:aspartate racemase
MGYVGSLDNDGVIGVLGGMGPSATLDLYRRFIAAVHVTGDQEHPRIIIDSNARTPDRTAALLDGGESPQQVLIDGAKLLENAGVHCVVIPCNTAHAFRAGIQAAVTVPVIDMIYETAARVPDDVTRVGLLASSGTVAVGLYQDALAARGPIDVLVPDADDQLGVMDVIWAVKREANGAALPQFLAICERMVARGAQALILGCTELSVLADGVTLPVTAVDPLDALVDTALTAIGYQKAEPAVVHSTTSA